MLDLLLLHPLFVAAIVITQLTFLAEALAYSRFNPTYFRLGLPLPKDRLPRMPLRETAGESGRVKWSGDGQVLHFRRRFSLIGRNAYAHGRLERDSSGAVSGTWSPFPVFSLLPAFALPVIFLSTNASFEGVSFFIPVLFLAIGVNILMSRYATNQLLNDLTLALEEG